MADTINIIIGLVIIFFVFKLLFGRADNNGNNTGNNSGRRHYVNPENVNAVASMFPQIPRSAIENDLAITGNVNLTCEKILRGDIVIPQESTSSTSTSFSKSEKVPGMNKIPIVKDLKTPIEEPEKIWKKTSEERQTDFSKRKLYMYQQARKRYMENKEKES